jgi:hypothetical protein
VVVLLVATILPINKRFRIATVATGLDDLTS